MPELGEVSHAASLLKRFLQGKVIRKVVANEDNLLYVKPLIATVFRDSVENLTVNDVKRHGKYFWIEFKDSPRIVLLHFGMTGWITVKGIKTHFIAMENGGDKKARDQISQGTLDAGIEVSNDPDMVWPPKFTKFILEADDDTQVAFTDPRRLGRVRLLEAANEQELFKQDPLSRNGIDFSKPEERWDFEQFKAAVTRRQVPIKSLLMDQTIFAGVGNWVADEILFQSRVHPEVRSNQLDSVELKTLYEKLIYVCEYVVRVEGEYQVK